MALRDQPYLPLYVQDVLTDEKLVECSADSIGVYVFIMCVMHKSKDYGTILLKQKDKQTPIQSSNFALKLVKHLPFTMEQIEKAIEELVEEEVLNIDGDILIQKRMVKDNAVSIARSKAGKKGGDKTQKNKKFAKANGEANSEYENKDEIINEVLNSKIWYEPIFMKKQISPDEGLEYLQIFLDKQEDIVGEGNGLNRDIDEIKNHFTNWFHKGLKQAASSGKTGKKSLIEQFEHLA